MAAWIPHPISTKKCRGWNDKRENNCSFFHWEKFKWCGRIKIYWKIVLHLSWLGYFQTQVSIFNSPKDNIRLQQDGAPPHFARVVRLYLNNVFLDWEAQFYRTAPAITRHESFGLFFMGPLKNHRLLNKPCQYSEIKRWDYHRNEKNWAIRDVAKCIAVLKIAWPVVLKLTFWEFSVIASTVCCYSGFPIFLQLQILLPEEITKFHENLHDWWKMMS